MVQPYISFVVTARNDNHGGDMLHRMQIFVDALLLQCKRFRVAAELLIVEWNPPSDRGPLRDALSWNVTDSPCDVRFVEVPREVHNLVDYGDLLPLFQMIAKNVGIRRARGKFVLATNIDIIFNDALFEKFAEKTLETNTIYRIDRHDVASHVPLNVSIEEQLQFCDANILRLNRQNITEPWTGAPVAIATVEAEMVETKAELPWTARAMIQCRHMWHEIKKDNPAWWQFVSSIVPMPVKKALFDDKLLGGLAYYFSSRERFMEGIRQALNMVDYQRDIPIAWVHTNACGDFTMLSKDDWLNLGAYPEYAMYSWHIDSIICHAAAAAGMKEQVFADPARIYHIEHGGGWTPNGAKKLFGRLKKRGIPFISDEQFRLIAHELYTGIVQPVFNKPDWGFASHDLPDYSLDESYFGNKKPVEERELVTV